MAYGFLVVPATGALLYALWACRATKLAAVAMLGGFVALLLLAPTLPATRRFLERQRRIRVRP